jgi:Family of unknown function (DUF6174)
MNAKTNLGRMRFCLSKRLGSLFIALMLLFPLLGCTTARTPGFIGPTSAPAWSTPKKKIDRAERKWNSRGINSYSIRVRVSGFWDQQEYTLVVRDGEVLDSSSTCVPAGPGEPCCTACFEPEDFTVPGLFANARDKASLSKITFDLYYGFPSTINYNNPAIADEEEEWKVLKFNPESP